ncbi:hypothetical protein [Methylophaga sp. OBS4]|uniref:hypothetical protein n=1 Tax=Methylophaga sp. OBS4 TaxID=2991935 RepID=UPI002251717E|nr:hypothetical protein [Methylophaga sp. OBS4]MCX4186732.1 hypothetical protein [Methylophaga sp. OBS4]
MMTAGVAIDAWKLAIFKKHLDDAGYEYTEHPGVTKNTLLLQVKTVSAKDLKPVIQNANTECAQWKQNQKLN